MCATILSAPVMYLSIKHQHDNMSLGSGCDHEFCTRCALYLCSTNCTSIIAKGPPGSIACPLCRHGIVLFVKLPGTRPVTKDFSRTSLSLPFCTCSSGELESSSLATPFCKPDLRCSRIFPLGSSFRSLSFQRFPSMKINSSLCMGAPEIRHSLVPCNVNRNLRNQLTRCSRSGLRRSASEGRRSWLSALNHYVTTGSGCWNFLISLYFSFLPYKVFFFPSFFSSITKDEGSHWIMIIGLVLVHINKH